MDVRPVLLDTLAAMYVTCNMPLMYCFDFSKSYHDFSFEQVHLFITKRINTAETEPYYWVGVMVGSVLHYILDLFQFFGAVFANKGYPFKNIFELHFCTMKLYCKHPFI